MAQTMVEKPKAWSYKAGKKGKNRVRAYEDEGQLLMEWQTPVFDNEGKAVIDPDTGKQLTRRERVSLTAAGITSYEDAMVKAIQSAKEFDKLIAPPPDEDAEKPREPVTLKQVIDRFMKERSPMCEPDTQSYHRCHR